MPAAHVIRRCFTGNIDQRPPTGSAVSQPHSRPPGHSAPALVHAQDIFVPLDREFPMPERPALVAADRIWQIPPPFGFGAKKRLRGLHIKATDTAWSRGEGPAIHGPLKAIVLLTSGRVDAALPHLSGDGMEVLAARHDPAGTAK
jgi:hypothetical protein